MGPPAVARGPAAPVLGVAHNAALPGDGVRRVVVGRVGARQGREEGTPPTAAPASPPVEGEGTRQAVDGHAGRPASVPVTPVTGETPKALADGPALGRPRRPTSRRPTAFLTARLAAVGTRAVPRRRRPPTVAAGLHRRVPAGGRAAAPAPATLRPVVWGVVVVPPVPAIPPVPGPGRAANATGQVLLAPRPAVVVDAAARPANVGAGGAPRRVGLDGRPLRPGLAPRTRGLTDTVAVGAAGAAQAGPEGATPEVED